MATSKAGSSRSSKVTLEPPKPKDGEKTKTPKEMASALKVDPKRLRRVMRELWGTHHERWAITPAMEKELRKRFAKK